MAGAIRSVATGCLRRRIRSSSVTWPLCLDKEDGQEPVPARPLRAAVPSHAATTACARRTYLEIPWGTPHRGSGGVSTSNRRMAKIASGSSGEGQLPRPQASVVGCGPAHAWKGQEHSRRGGGNGRRRVGGQETGRNTGGCIRSSWSTQGRRRRHTTLPFDTQCCSRLLENLSCTCGDT